MVKSKSKPDLKQDLQLLNKVNMLKRQVIRKDYGAKTKVAGKDKKVFDRKFSVGQRVLYHGKCGTVTEIVPVATVCIMNSEKQGNKYKTPSLLTKVDISQLRPMTRLFYGVNIEFMGWIGQILDVERRVTFKFDDSSHRVSKIFYDSLIIRNSLPSTSPCAKSSSSPASSHKLFGYPFMPTSDMPYKGAVATLSNIRLKQFINKEEEADKRNNENFASADSSSFTTKSDGGSPTGLSDSIKAKVESVLNASITVQWTGRLPAHLITLCCDDERETRVPFYSTSTPPTTLGGEDLTFIRSLYIHPSMYFEKNGLCLYKMEQDEEKVSQEQWAHDLYKSLGKEKLFNSSTTTVASSTQENDSNPPDDDFGSGKRKRWCHKSEEKLTGEGQDVVVCKHLVQHMYKVIWERNHQQKTNGKSYITPCGREPSYYYGNQLEPDLTQEHKLCLGFIHSHLYVVPRKGTWMEGGPWDYGVVTDKLSINFVVVEWMKINWEDGNVNVARIVKCELVELDKHPSFNELHEGRIVVRAKQAQAFKECQDFSYGTVVSVKRFSLGQISVYCPVQQKVLEFWPHMLELFVGMSMQELIARRLVGLRKKEPITTEEI